MEVVFILGICITFIGGALLYHRFFEWHDNRDNIRLNRERIRHNEKCEKLNVPHLKVDLFPVKHRKHAVTAA